MKSSEESIFKHSDAAIVFLTDWEERSRNIVKYVKKYVFLNIQEGKPI